MQLGDIVTRMSNGTVQRQDKNEVGLPVTRIETISNGTINLKKVGYLNHYSPETIEKFRLKYNDVLFSHINSDSHIGKTAIFKLDCLLIHGMNLLLIRPNTAIIDPDFLTYVFRSYRFSGKFLSIAQHAVNQSSINQSKLRTLPIPLPPLNEQKRIVAKVEALVAESKTALTTLDKIPFLIRECRQSILNRHSKVNLHHESQSMNPYKSYLKDY